MRLRISTRIKASPWQVFEWWTDFTEHDPALSGKILRSRKNLQRQGNLVTFEDEGRMAGIGYRDRVEVRLFPPNKWTAKYDSTRFEAFSTYTVEPDGDSSLLTVETEVNFRGVLKLFGRLARRFIERSIAREWSDYRKLIELEAQKDAIP